MLPTKFRFIWPNGYRREEFFKSANQKQESPMAAMFVNGSFMFMIVCFIKKNVFCGKGDNSNLNIDISQIQLAMN
jgi:hypothetical protein